MNLVSARLVGGLQNACSEQGSLTLTFTFVKNDGIEAKDVNPSKKLLFNSSKKNIIKITVVHSVI